MRHPSDEPQLWGPPMKWECTACGNRYDDTGMPPMSAPPTCSNGKRHKQRVMVKRDEYQCVLDDLGIPLDDPLRFATD